MMYIQNKCICYVYVCVTTKNIIITINEYIETIY